MKTLVKKLFVTTLATFLNLVIVFNTLADEGKFAYVLHPLHNTNLLYFGYNVNPKHLDVEIKIRDERGVILHKEVFNKEKSAKLFNFDKLGKGKFFVEIKAGDFVEKKEVLIGQHLKADEVIKVQIMPQIENGVEVIYLNNDSEVAISIIDQKGNVIHNEVSTIRDYRRKFNTKKLPVGKYIVRVAQGTHVYQQEYEVK